MKSIKLIAAALLLAASPAFAANWVYVTTDTDGTVYYYDADTVQRSGNQVTVWEKWDHSRDKTIKERERKRQYQYDCAESTSTLLHSIIYYPDGTVRSVAYKTYEQEADPIVPDTIGAVGFEAVCSATAP